MGTASKPEKIIIDTDIGIDDAMAIFFAMAAPELELIGLTTNYGNSSLEHCTRNALYAVALSGQTIPVAQGADRPLVLPPEPPADFVHGTNGLGNVTYPEDENRQPIEQSAAEFIIEQSKLYPGELTLVPIGRLTNIAQALELDPELPKRIKRVVIMGGTVKRPGNVSPVAEANIIGDPHAADIVFTADWDVIMIGLDATQTWILQPTDLDALTATNQAVGKYITDISQFYFAFYATVGLENGCYMHDASTILYLLRPDLFESVQAPIRVACEGVALGQTIAAFPPMDTRPGAWQNIPKTTIPMKIDGAQATQYFIETLATLKFDETLL